VRIKSYFAKSITEAMERARVELGPDAMIIASNKTAGDAMRLGAYEVVFGLADQASAAEPEKPQANEGLERLRARMESMRISVSKKREQVSAAKAPVAGRIAAVLRNSGFSPDLADELGSSVQNRCRDGKQDILGGLRAELNARVRVAPKPGATISLVGPAGAGKTTTLVKLAVAYGIAKGRPVRLISTDTYRLGGTDLLRRYADAMGVAFEASANVDALQRILENQNHECLTLIDTPGPSASNGEANAALASFLAKRADIEVHLVLPSFAGSEELRGMAGKFKSFVPSKLLFTGLDSCSNTGPMLAFALQRETAISFLGTGPEVPEDLEEAAAGSLTARLLPSLMDVAVAAA